MDRRKFIKMSTQTALGVGFAMKTASVLSPKPGEAAMGKTILALAGSPRKQGNTDTLLTEMLHAAEQEGASTEKIYVIDQNIVPCTMCEECHTEARKPCILEDDFQQIVEKIVAADIIVLASPVHWWAISSPLKLVLDRSYSLVDKQWKNSLIAGKSGVIISCCASPDTQKFTDAVVNSITHYFNFMGIQLEDTVTASAGFQPGIVAENAEAMSKAAEVGKKLALLV